MYIGVEIRYKKFFMTLNLLLTSGVFVVYNIPKLWKAVFNMALKRINLNLDEELLSQLDDYANQMHITRSAAISVLLSQLFQGQKTMQTMGDLVSLYKDEKKKGNVWECQPLCQLGWVRGGPRKIIAGAVPLYYLTN